MSEEFESIKRGLQKAVDDAKGKTSLKRKIVQLDDTESRIRDSQLDSYTQTLRKSSQVSVSNHKVLRGFQIKIKEALKPRKRHICHIYKLLEPLIKSF